MSVIEFIKLSEKNHYNDIDEKTAREYYNQAISLGMKIIDIESPEYPNNLRAIERPPFVLYCIGDISLLKRKSVAIVGTRRASSYGRWAASEIASSLATNRVVHVSGMAEGIDSEGHRAVIEKGGKSIAVLGTGADVCFPRSSRDVYEKLKIEGLIISEYRPGTSGYPGNFPERNRIISGLSEKLVVVEGALRSGSLITAKIALEQGKTIYAVPGNINQPNSIVPNQLIEDGAIPITTITEIAETLGIGFDENCDISPDLIGIQKEIYDILKLNGSLRADDIANLLDISIEIALSSLVAMELKGLILAEGEYFHL